MGGVCQWPHLGHPQLHHEAVSDVLDVLTHQLGVHAHERARQRVAHKLLFDLHGVLHDVLQSLRLQRELDVAAQVRFESRS